ncbi:phage virion morphogenesis protein [Laribacter hongkongensis]|uniref:phage virion morphogenesis protein n=1 Tax=Laribacter hongkongensis TaxID=168471 RepID=UPI001EFEDEBE|nr:phage virion morphogenesis protein [Laribacter hongkongensis]MCG9060252.1 phage virion morphogenesis protein [Laribacter hongkongensis]MCG9087385.1 phage virion morphogenesis protein [Laribacter hongkongensis]
MIDIRIERSWLTEALTGLVQACRQRAPLMKELAGDMADAVESNFEAQGRPAWQGIRSRPGGRILQDSGRLASSIVSGSDNDSAVVGTNVVYAAIHHHGGKTRPHVIRARHAKALRFGGRFARSVNHPGSAIPARPFLSLTDDDATRMEQRVADYLRQAIDG